LVVTRFNVHFTPGVEIGWRLAFEHWGRGYATEAARLAAASTRSLFPKSYRSPLRQTFGHKR
jgi:hypothetical protein